RGRRRRDPASRGHPEPVHGRRRDGALRHRDPGRARLPPSRGRRPRDRAGPRRAQPRARRGAAGTAPDRDRHPRGPRDRRPDRRPRTPGERVTNSEPGETSRVNPSRQGARMIKPYTAVGLIPTVRGIRKRKDIKINLDHLSHLVKAASWLSSLDLPVRLIAFPEGALQAFNDEVLDLDHATFARECAIDIPGEETEPLGKIATEYGAF